MQVLFYIFLKIFLLCLEMSINWGNCCSCIIIIIRHLLYSDRHKQYGQWLQSWYQVPAAHIPNSLASSVSTSSAVYVLSDFKESMPLVSSASISARFIPKIDVGLADGK